MERRSLERDVRRRRVRCRWKDMWYLGYKARQHTLVLDHRAHGIVAARVEEHRGNIVGILGSTKFA